MMLKFKVIENILEARDVCTISTLEDNNCLKQVSFPPDWVVFNNPRVGDLLVTNSKGESTVINMYAYGVITDELPLTGSSS